MYSIQILNDSTFDKLSVGLPLRVYSLWTPSFFDSLLLEMNTAWQQWTRSWGSPSLLYPACSISSLWSLRKLKLVCMHIAHCQIRGKWCMVLSNCHCYLTLRCDYSACWWMLPTSNPKKENSLATLDHLYLNTKASSHMYVSIVNTYTWN